MKSVIKYVDDHGMIYPCLAFICPGCVEFGHTGLHTLPVNTDKKSPAWEWDGNLYSPTISPSILTKWSGVDSQGSPQELICHSFLKNGIFEFLSDSTHKLCHQKVPIPDLPDWAAEKNPGGDS